MSAIKLKIDGVIDDLGNTITIRSPGVKTYDEWGEPIKTTQTDVETIGVNYNYFISNMSPQSAGRVKDFDSDLIIKGEEIVSNDHTIIIDGIEFNITNIYPIKSGNVLVAQQVKLGSK